MADPEKISCMEYATVEDLQLPEAICIFHNQSISEAYQIMTNQDFSQLPVVNAARKLIGMISLDKIKDYKGSYSESVQKVTTLFGKKEPYLLITPWTRLADLRAFFDTHYAGFVTDGLTRWPLAVVTRDDLDHASKYISLNAI